MDRIGSALILFLSYENTDGKDINSYCFCIYIFDAQGLLKIFH